MSVAAAQLAPPYPWYVNLVPLLAGIVDPLVGLFTVLVRPFLSRSWPARTDSPRRRGRGLTLILGGIEGPSQYAVNMARGLLKAGYRGSVHLFPWNRGIPFCCWFRNLANRRHHEEQADRLARRILEYKRQYPAAPVCILAQSGGCWITVRALERLPTGVRVQTAVLLAPSISPAYDISAAAAKCDGGLVSIGGPGDLFFLALATTILGTSDRVHTPAAGWIGWHYYYVPGFTEVRWHPSWIKYGYFGNHTSSSAVGFVQHVVADRLKRGVTRRGDCLAHPLPLPI